MKEYIIIGEVVSDDTIYIPTLDGYIDNTKNIYKKGETLYASKTIVGGITTDINDAAYIEEQTYTYCVEVDRSGICEENMTLHYTFKEKPSRENILNLLIDEDMGYNDQYCSFNYYKIS